VAEAFHSKSFDYTPGCRNLRGSRPALQVLDRRTQCVKDMRTSYRQLDRRTRVVLNWAASMSFSSLATCSHHGRSRTSAPSHRAAATIRRCWR